MKKEVIFYSPHADDETLNMGILLATYAKNYPTYVVLFTKGYATTALDAINGTIYSGFWKGKHNPSFEGYNIITKEELAEARVREFKQACVTLGVPLKNIYLDFLDTPTQGSIIYKDAKEALKKYIQMYPNALHFSLSYKDIHKDHSTIGEALVELISTNLIKKENVKFVISVATRNSLKNKKIPKNWEKITCKSKEIEIKVLNAIKCYCAWAPLVKSYAVGFHSVAGQFYQFEKELFHYVHNFEETIS